MSELDNVLSGLDCGIRLKDFLKTHLQEMEMKDHEEYLDTITKLNDTKKPINIETAEELDEYLSKLHHKVVEDKGLWDVSDTSKIANSIGINFDTSWYNKYSFNYVMNMVRADFYDAIEQFTAEYPSTKGMLDNPKLYAYLAKEWLGDEDAPKSKLMSYLHYIVG